MDSKVDNTTTRSDDLNKAMKCDFLSGIAKEACVPCCEKGVVRGEISKIMFIPLRVAQQNAEGNTLPFDTPAFEPRYGLYIPCSSEMIFPFLFKRDDVLRFLLFFEIATALNQGCGQMGKPGVWIAFKKMKHGLLLYMQVNCNGLLLMAKKYPRSLVAYPYHKSLNDEDIHPNHPPPPPPLSPALGAAGFMAVDAPRNQDEKVNDRTTFFYATVRDACRFLAMYAETSKTKSGGGIYNDYIRNNFSPSVYMHLYNDYITKQPGKFEEDGSAFTHYFKSASSDCGVTAEDLFDVYLALRLAYQRDPDEFDGRFFGANASRDEKEACLSYMVQQQGVMLLFPRVVDSKDTALLLPLTLTTQQLLMLNKGLSLVVGIDTESDQVEEETLQYCKTENDRLTFNSTALNFPMNVFLDLSIEELREATLQLLAHGMPRKDVFQLAWAILSTSMAMPPNVMECVQRLNDLTGKSFGVRNFPRFKDLSMFGNVKVYYQQMIEMIANLACHHDNVLLCLFAHLSSYDFQPRMQYNVGFVGGPASGKTISLLVAKQLMVPGTFVEVSAFSPKALMYPVARGLSGRHPMSVTYGRTVVAEETIPGLGIVKEDHDPDMAKASIFKAISTGARQTTNAVVNTDTWCTEARYCKSTFQCLFATNNTPDYGKPEARRVSFRNVPVSDGSVNPKCQKRRYVNNNFSDLRHKHPENQQRIEYLWLIESLCCAIDSLIYLGLFEDVEHKVSDFYCGRCSDNLEQRMRVNIITSASQRVGTLSRVFAILTAAFTFSQAHSRLFQEFQPVHLFLVEPMLSVTLEMAMTAVSYTAADFVDPVLEMVCRGLNEICQSIHIGDPLPTVSIGDQVYKQMSWHEIQRVVARYNVSSIVSRSLSSSSSSSSLSGITQQISLLPSLASRTSGGGGTVVNGNQVAPPPSQTMMETNICDALATYLHAQNPNIALQVFRQTIIELKNCSSLRLQGSDLLIDQGVLHPDAHSILRDVLVMVASNLQAIDRNSKWLCVHPLDENTPNIHHYVLGACLCADLPYISDILSIMHNARNLIPTAARSMVNTDYVNRIVDENIRDTFLPPSLSLILSSADNKTQPRAYIRQPRTYVFTGNPSIDTLEKRCDEINRDVLLALITDPKYKFIHYVVDREDEKDAYLLTPLYLWNMLRTSADKPISYLAFIQDTKLELSTPSQCEPIISSRIRVAMVHQQEQLTRDDNDDDDDDVQSQSQSRQKEREKRKRLRDDVRQRQGTKSLRFEGFDQENDVPPQQIQGYNPAQILARPRGATGGIMTAALIDANRMRSTSSSSSSTTPPILVRSHTYPTITSGTSGLMIEDTKHNNNHDTPSSDDISPLHEMDLFWEQEDMDTEPALQSPSPSSHTNNQEEEEEENE